MKLINTGTIDITVEGNLIPAGRLSENIDDILARQIVASSGGSIAIAPEVEHTPEELAHADEKPKPEPALLLMDQYRIKAPVTPEGEIEEEKKKKPEKAPTKTGS